MRATASPETIRPSWGWVPLRLRDLWEYRELLYFLVWRDIKVRYKQTVLGTAWAIIQPFFTMVVFSIFFGQLAGIPLDGLPYPVFAYCALLPWQLFSHALTQSGNSLVGHQNLITKVYFRRLATSLLPVDPHPTLKPGMAVEVIRGPMVGVRGILIRKGPRTRLLVAISLLCQGASVEIGAADVVPV